MSNKRKIPVDYQMRKGVSFEHQIGELINYDEVFKDRHTIYDWMFKGKTLRVEKDPEIIPKDPYHTKCELICVLAKTNLCDCCKCLNWQRKDNTNIRYVFTD